MLADFGDDWFLNAFFLNIGFSPCVVVVVWGLTITKLAMPFFLLFYFCIFRHVVTSFLRIVSFAFLLAFLIFTIVHAFACLPYFLQWFHAFLNCFL